MVDFKIDFISSINNLLTYLNETLPYDLILDKKRLSVYQLNLMSCFSSIAETLKYNNNEPFNLDLIQLIDIVIKHISDSYTFQH